MNPLGEHRAVRVFAAWLKDHQYNPDFSMADAQMVNGSPMILFFCKSNPEKPWSIQYRGNGHYYGTKKEALLAATAHGWKV